MMNNDAKKFTDKDVANALRVRLDDVTAQRDDALAANQQLLTFKRESDALLLAASERAERAERERDEALQRVLELEGIVVLLEERDR